ncbi:MAG: RagB/SusD family nutrient uptake outer membrane protein [Bacteroidales bacterium]|nr:RagB/SusD family nutrient uptake outer membrane protein [Bacteroidales bacterium]
MKKYILCLALIGGVLSSCSDFLTEEPPLSQSNELTLSTFEGLNSAAAGMYSPLQSENWYGAEMSLAPDLRGGIAKRATNQSYDTGRMITSYQWQYSEDNASPLWNYAYFVISQANNVLNNLEGKESSEVSAIDINNLKAECLFVRALSYFDLVRVYAQPYTYAPASLGVPVVLETKISSPKRDNVETVYNQIVTDLTDAESLMSEDYQRSGISDPTGAASKAAIQALLARAYLYMGNYQKAAESATKVINNKNYSLYTADNYKSQWTKQTAEKGGEVIFQVNGSMKNGYYPAFEGVTYLTSSKGYGDVIASADLLDLYEDGDVRAKIFVSTDDAPDHFWTLKYAGYDGTTAHLENNIVVLRLSEMYLIRSEAILNGANVSGVTAADDLNMITSHRGASYVSPSMTSILIERRKELAFEGHASFDYARTKTSLIRTDYNGVSTNKDISFPSYKWALPIPKREMQANPNMEQNEGYKK